MKRTHVHAVLKPSPSVAYQHAMTDDAINCLIGLHGKMYRAIRSMYNVVKVRVRVGGDPTEAFMCPRSLKQGEIYSPIWFSLFVSEFANEIIQNGKHGITLSPELFQIRFRLFADDVVLLSYTVIGLQQQLNSLRDTVLF